MCQTCDKLRAEIRELREELAEWERGGNMTDSGDVALIAATIKCLPQSAKLISALMNAENRTVSAEILTEEIEYGGMGGDINRARKSETYEGNHLKVIVSRSRRDLERAGIFDAIANVRGVGYIMPKRKAQEIRKLAGIE